MQGQFAKDFGMGLLFAGLGCYSVIFADNKKKKQPQENKENIDSSTNE